MFQLKRDAFSKRTRLVFASTSSQNGMVVSLTFSRRNMLDGNHVTFKQKIQICQHFYDFKRTLKGLLSQKEYLVYFTNICRAATAAPLVPFWEYQLNLQFCGNFLPCERKL